MSETQYVTAVLTTIHCSCGGVYAITSRSFQTHQQEGTCWTCPYCQCSWGFSGRGSNAILQRDLREANDRLARERAQHDQTREALKHTERSRAVVRGHLKRTKTRISKGVCPCCNRSFENVARHMANKHPGFDKEGVV